MAYIEREALVKEFDKISDHDVDVDEAIELIADFPAADVAPVKHGRWIKSTKINGQNFSIPHCSVCEGVPCGVNENTHYCPNCGAKMMED